MEEHARETEARAQSLCASALERLRLAEMRAEAAERAQRELIITAEHKLQGACRALEQAQSCVEAQKDKLAAAELRAEVAEAEAREAKKMLTLVEDAIRKRLLCAMLIAVDSGSLIIATAMGRRGCVSAWNKDPVFGVIGIQSGSVCAEN